MEDSLVSEGLEEALANLESLLAEHVGEDQDILICTQCFQTKDFCRCSYRVVMWPLRQAVYSLRLKLNLGLW
jgi:hypothetical protein